MIWNHYPGSFPILSRPLDISLSRASRLPILKSPHCEHSRKNGHGHITTAVPNPFTKYPHQPRGRSVTSTVNAHDFVVVGVCISGRSLSHGLFTNPRNRPLNESLLSGAGQDRQRALASRRLDDSAETWG